MLTAGSRVGDYVIEEELGAGGMARVYRAHHAVLETAHALKVLEPEYRVNAGARQRFLDEARIQAKHLDHPNIVKVTNIVATEEHAALVMELVEGGNLESQLAAIRQRPDEVKRIMLAVLDAVGHAHDAGIIHRDLKPANVLLQRKGGAVVPKVTDFGIAKVTAAAGASGKGKKSTHGEARMGTLSYMSPEQIRRSKDVTPRSDVFSLGAMLYELSTGEAPFGGDSDYDIMESVVNGRYRPPEEVDAKIDPVVAAVIRRALEPDPAKRFASCAEMAAALRGEAAARAPSTTTSASPSKITSTSTSPSTFTSKTPPAKEAKRGGKRVALLAGLGGIAAIAGAALLLPRGGSTPTTAGKDGGVAALEDAAIALAPLDAPAPRCPTGMVLVPGGTFLMGSPDGVGDADEHPQREVTLSAFCIDRTEVTVAAYAACEYCTPAGDTVEWKDLTPALRRLWDGSTICNANRAERQDHPVNCVTWEQAFAYCRAVDRRLPTEAQWEYAARGTDGRTYPWGEAPPSARLLDACGAECARYLDAVGMVAEPMHADDDGAGATAPVGSYPDGASPFGVLDLAGNVNEWVADEYLDRYPAGPITDPAPATTSDPPSKTRRAQRGGGWLTREPERFRIAYRRWQNGSVRDVVNGFRCAREPLSAGT